MRLLGSPAAPLKSAIACLWFRCSELANWRTFPPIRPRIGTNPAAHHANRTPAKSWHRYIIAIVRHIQHRLMMTERFVVRLIVSLMMTGTPAATGGSVTR